MFKKKSTVCNIKFPGRESGEFHPSEVLKCNIELITQKAKTLKEIYVIATGISKVDWEEAGVKRKLLFHNETPHFTTKAVLQKNDNENTFELPSGTHSYNCQFQLPAKLPTSFKCKYGQNDYEIKVILSRKFRHDQEFIKKFHIICPLDLNSNSQFRDPIEVVEAKSTFFKIFKMEPFTIRVLMPFSGYIPGQKIPCTIDVTNESKVDCNSILVKFLRYAFATATSPYEKVLRDKIELATDKLPGVKQSNREQFVCRLEVPPTPASSMELSDIILVAYSIIIEAIMDGVHENVKMDIPIIIGTEPLVNKH